LKERDAQRAHPLESTTKEIAMAKSSVAVLATELERMPERVEDARKALDGFRAQGIKLVRRYPGRSILGALAAGFVIAKIARRF
jgi:hypothetical protein